VEAAITPATVAIAYAATPADQPPLRQIAGVAAAHGLPVIVDAAAQLPPAANLRRFIAEGASLVAYSGGKALRGPQSTGILCGRRDLIAAALLQQLDMDVAPETWEPPPALIDRAALQGIPHHGLGRGFKVGKEEIVGLIVALERFAASDGQAEQALREGMLRTVAAALAGLAHVEARLLPAARTGRSPLLELALDEGALGRDAYALSRALQARRPPVHLGERRAAEGILIVDPSALAEGDEQRVAEALAAVLAPA
jgi:L-seryl-tRNA(Ser) seleniumtransferase